MEAQFTLKKKKEGTTLLIAGDLTVPSAPLFKEKLLSIDSHAGRSTISLSDVTSADASAAQLLYAFITACKEKNKTYSITWPADVTVFELLAKTGIKNLIQ